MWQDAYPSRRDGTTGDENGYQGACCVPPASARSVRSLCSPRWFPAEAAETCLGAPYRATGADGTAAARIAMLVAGLGPVLDRFPRVAALLEDPAPVICVEDQLGEALGYFEPESLRIALRRSLPDDLSLGILLHELRHVDQFMRDICVPDGLAMVEHARAVAAMEADASAISLLMAWDLREQGDPGIWNALAAWPSQSDIAAGMAEVFARGGSAADAVSRAFELWYAREDRVLRYYRASCGAWLDEQDRTHLLGLDGTLAPSFLAGLCAMPDGGAYACVEPGRPQ